MDEYRRSGLDRRADEQKADPERRAGSDRRDIFQHQNVIIGKLKETHFFRNFKDEDFIQLLSICSRKTIKKDKIIFYEGDKSIEMFILMNGVLQVTLQGKVLSLVTPIGFIGEMGVFTGETRSATVLAKTDCELIQLNRFELFNLLDENSSLNNRFQLGMINNLCSKLRNTNDLIITLKTQ